MLRQGISGLGFLEVSFGVVVVTASKAEEFRLGADDGFVGFVAIGATGDHEVGVVAAVLEAAFF